jgi:hypothetical protein
MSEPTPGYYRKLFKGIKLDPYRVCKVYGIGGGPREQSIKYLLRGTDKDNGIDTELDLIKAVRKQLGRWEEMILEDVEDAKLEVR